jgi:hypothetical protein
MLNDDEPITLALAITRLLIHNYSLKYSGSSSCLSMNSWRMVFSRACATETGGDVPPLLSSGRV